MKSSRFALAVLLLASGAPVFGQDAAEIVRRSVAAVERSWNAAPAYSFVERDSEVANGKRSVRQSAVVMIDGSPYYRLLSNDGKPLSPAQAAREQRAFDLEIANRGRESPSARRKRIAQYDKERRQDHALMMEMSRAFVFRLVGRNRLNGHAVYVLDAEPKPGYQPPSFETRVLTGMRGRLWVDCDSYQWVRVEAEVFRPVTFGFFIAKAEPGTRFALDQEPVDGAVWLPTRFTMSVNATVLWWRKTSTEVDVFTSYRKAASPAEFAEDVRRTFGPAGRPK